MRGAYAATGALQGGMTLLEVLVALAVAGVVTLVLGQLLSGTRASESALDRALDPLQVLDLAAELLGAEVSLAAAIPWPVPASIDDLPSAADPRGFVTPGLVIETAAAGERLSVYYVDDRSAEGPRARAVAFEAATDARGEPQLYRRAGTASRQPLVAGVDSLRVQAVVQAGRLVEPRAAAVDSPDSPLWAIVLRLQAGESTRDVTIGLPYRPLVEVRP